MVKASVPTQADHRVSGWFFKRDRPIGLKQRCQPAGNDAEDMRQGGTEQANAARSRQDCGMIEVGSETGTSCGIG
jgi:hypothetical protein